MPVLKTLNVKCYESISHNMSVDNGCGVKGSCHLLSWQCFVFVVLTKEEGQKRLCNISILFS